MAVASLNAYLDGQAAVPECAIDWDHLEPQATTLQTAKEIPCADHRSYSDLDQSLDAGALGHLLGRNPIPLFMPCHRVSLGTEIPDAFVGGPDRRRWLEAHEQQIRRS